MSMTILTNEVHNQDLFEHFNTLMDYCGYSLHIQGPKWLLPQIIEWIQNEGWKKVLRLACNLDALARLRATLLVCLLI